MNYKNKYLKYKNKYLELKQKKLKQKKLKQKKMFGETCKFTVVPNSGAADGMTNQCLWISIRDYINIFLDNPITLTQLRQEAGLTMGLENTPFDNDDNNFNIAINKIANKYDLTINFYLINNDGNVITKLDDNGNAQSFMLYGHGQHIVNITSYGMNHFQLILSGCGLPKISPEIMNRVNKKIIEPKIFYKNEFININFLEDSKDLNNILIENEIINIKNQIKLYKTSKQIYNDTIESLNDKINQALHDLNKIADLSNEEKNIIMNDQIETANDEKDDYHNLIISTVEIIEKLEHNFENLINYKDQINTYYNFINQSNDELAHFIINLENLNLSDKDKIIIISEYEHTINNKIQEFNQEIRKFEELIQKIIKNN